MEQNVLTLILLIPEKENVEYLESVFNNIRQQSVKAPQIDFRKSNLTHFARFVIIDTEDQKFHAKRLLFTSNFDGNLELYAKELIESGNASAIDDIFSKCEGYKQGDMLELSRATAFLKKHNIKAQAFFVALRGITQNIINKSADIRRQLDLLLDTGQVNAYDKEAVASLYTNYQNQRASHSSGVKPRQKKVTIAYLLLNILSSIIEWMVGIRHKNSTPGASVKTKASLYDMEDLYTQNQMTIIVPVKTSFLSRILLRSILFFVNLKASFSKGTLSDLTTIHFAHWAILKGGDQLLFESNFDGSWENYIDDFVDHASVGMNAIWGNCVSFPAGGCKDIESFKMYIRQNQTPAQLFYSAYKESTVNNILTDLSIAQQAAAFERPNGMSNFIMGYYGG